MAEFHINPAERAKIVTKWIKITLFFLHVWASMAVIAGLWGADKDLCIDIFKTCTFGIGATLLILLFDRAADAILGRIAGSTPGAAMTVKEETTTTKTVTPAPKTDAPVEANDVNINAKNVNVGNPEG